jgi:hypothetical protein
VADPGTLWSGVNGHFTRGGDFEKRKAFTVYATLPPGTTGLAKQGGSLYVFGSAAPPAMPPGVNYMQLPHPTVPGATLTSVNSWDLFNGLLYVVAFYGGLGFRHFYNGVNITDWGSGGTKPPAWGSIVRTFKRKVYSPIISVLWGSALDAPTVWDTSIAGSFFQNMSNHQSGSDLVTALAVYQNYMAIFSRRLIQIWDMQNDSALNAPVQYLDETGTRAARSVIGFGDVDAFYLSDSGVRSLRARSGTNIAGVNDVGTPIDTVIRDWTMTLTQAQIEQAVSIVEPVDGRFWLAIGSRVFVFTYFPTKKISAWSYYEPGFTFSDLVTLQDRVYGRSGDTIYLYGGADNNTYDSSPVLCEFPFLSGGKPGTYKFIKGIDIAAQGAWNVRLLVNPEDENDWIDVGDISGVTFIQENIGAVGHSTYIAPRLVNQAPGYASISQLGIYNDAADSE